MGLKIDIQNFYNDYLPATLSALVTVPSGYRYVIKSLILRSEDATEKAIAIKLRRSGKTITISPEILKELHTWVMDEAITLEYGDSLLGSTAFGAKVGCKISGVREQI